jgi:hypothetical protein
MRERPHESAATPDCSSAIYACSTWCDAFIIYVHYSILQDENAPQSRLNSKPARAITTTMTRAGAVPRSHSGLFLLMERYGRPRPKARAGHVPWPSGLITPLQRVYLGCSGRSAGTFPVAGTRKHPRDSRQRSHEETLVFPAHAPILQVLFLEIDIGAAIRQRDFPCHTVRISVTEMFRLHTD